VNRQRHCTPKLCVDRFASIEGKVDRCIEAIETVRLTVAAVSEKISNVERRWYGGEEPEKGLLVRFDRMEQRGVRAAGITSAVLAATISVIVSGLTLAIYWGIVHENQRDHSPAPVVSPARP